jgi:ZIP family zinc transporter
LTVWIEAFLWGLVVGSGLIMGAAISYFFNLQHRLIAAVMGFGGGVLISVLAFELTEEAYIHGGFTSSATGFLSISLAGGVAIGKAVLIGFFLANIPEALASASGMKKSGRSAKYIFGVWGGITVLTGIAGMLGYSVFGRFPSTINAFITALAAGGILSMVAETMIPEAFEESQSFIGFITATGFLAFFLLMKTGW